MCETQKIECLSTLAFPSGVFDGKSSKLQHFGLGRLHLQAELAQSVYKVLAKPLRIRLVLKADNEVVCVPDEAGISCAALTVNLLKP